MKVKETEQELTAAEVLDILSEIRNCQGRCCEDCLISGQNNDGYGYCTSNLGVSVVDKNRLIKICKQWKVDHEKKEPEIETVDVCRIIEILPDGRKRCVHEEDIKPDSDFPFGGNECEAVEEILKSYCMEHEGKFIAVHEVISRVKAVN